MLARNDEWWKYRFHHLDSEHHRGGFGPMFYALHEGADGPDAYAVYRVKIDRTRTASTAASCRWSRP